MRGWTPFVGLAVILVSATGLLALSASAMSGTTTSESVPAGGLEITVTFPAGRA